MKSKRYLVVCLLSCLIFTPVNANTAVENYGSLPTVSQVEISPDGNTLALLQTIDDIPAIVLADLTKPGSTPRVAGLGGVKARRIRWVDDDFVVARVSQTETLHLSSGMKKIELKRWLALNTNSLKLKQLFGNTRGYYIHSAGDLVSTLPNKPGKALFSRIYPEHGESLYEVDLSSGKTKLIEIGEIGTSKWIVHEDGSVDLRIDHSANKLSVYKKLGDDFELMSEHTSPVAGEVPFAFLGRSAEHGKYYVSLYNADDYLAIGVYNVEDGDLEDEVTSVDKLDIDEYYYNERKAIVTALAFVDEQQQVHHFKEKYNTLQKTIKSALGTKSANIVSISKDSNRIIIRANYDDHPHQYFMYDKKANRLDLVAKGYEKLDGTSVARKEKYDYETDDGLIIPGYVTFPAKSEGRMPLIVLPHGGPYERDDKSFDWWSFFYAANGYAVYQPNFRGSSGYGLDFEEASYGEWSKKMRTDIDNGVLNLIKQGKVDQNRICIIGASYGGYAALSGAAFSENLYKCAVSVNGVTDLLLMLGDASKSGVYTEEYWNEQLQADRFDTAKVQAISPMNNIDKFTQPILLIHAEDDIVVDVAYSRKMSKLLKRADKPHKLVILDGEDHWLSTGPTRRQMLKESITFIEKYIGAKN